LRISTREVPRTEVVFYREIERAVERKRRFDANPAAHTFQPEE